MLPLWIIDLRKQSDRRDLFVDLLGQIDHVYLAGLTCDGSKSDIISTDTNRSYQTEAEALATECADEPAVDLPVAPVLENDTSISEVNEIVVSSDENEEEEDAKSIEERIEAIEKKKALRESVIEGCWWRYSPMADRSYGIDISDVNLNGSAKEAAEKLYKFQTDLVEEGQKFIRALRESNAHPDIKINVIVLGDIEEDFTRIVFPSVAAILQKEKGKILPHHIHQGLEIIGMLYIPSDINTKPVDLRLSMQRTLNEIDVQHKVPDMRGYDHVMLYQDIQNRTECFYPALNDRQLQEYLFQCIVNIYFATDETHPLLSGTSSAEIFYFSMGATSVCYDVENEDLKARHEFGLNFMKSIKMEGEDDKANLKLNLLDSEEYEPAKFFDFEAISQVTDEEVEEEKPRLHPIKDFYAKYLKRYYYGKYLRNYTKILLQKITSTIDNNTRGALDILGSTSKRKFKEAKVRLFEKLKDTVTQLSVNEGGLPTIVRLFKEMQEKLSAMKGSVQNAINVSFWTKIEQEKVPRKMQDSFMEYHDAYEEDIRAKNGGIRQNEFKKDAIRNLNDLLGQEATTLSRICRSILLGIMLALAVVPVLNLISPHFINLGKVRRYSEWWSVGVFFLPVLFQFYSWLRYERKKKNLVNTLKAYFLHDAYARVANRIESEITSFYDKMIDLADRYVKRTENISKRIDKGYEDLELVKPLIPETMFNQSLLGGKFGKDSLLPVPDAEDTLININYIPYKIKEIHDKEFFLFMNEHHNMVMELYKDVDTLENLVRRINESGEEELVTREQQEKEQDELWEKHLSRFQKDLSLTIKEKIVPRINDSVGEFLVSGIEGKIVDADILKPMVDFAANNGEITSSADIELLDIKINDKKAVQYLLPYVATPFKTPQIDKYNYLYRKYIFVTRWRCFEHFSLNRILPMEDFDDKYRSQYVYDAEKKSKKLQEADKDTILEVAKETEYIPYTSTLLLWALSQDDSSAEWFRLLDSNHFREALEDREAYKEILNQND